MKRPTTIAVKLRAFRSLVPVSQEAGEELDHMGTISFPHDRENCPGCKANRVIREQMREVLRKMAEDVDRKFLGER